MKTIALLAAFLPAAALAGGYAVPNTNARDLAMCGSVVAGQRDALAAYVNPAALAGLEGLSVVANGTIIDFRSRWSDPTNQNAPVTMTPKGVFPPSVFASYSGKTEGFGWGVGAGINVPGGGEVFWPGDWAGRFDVLTVDRRIYGMYLTGGIQPIPQIKIGGGLVYYRGTEHLVQGVNYVAYEGGAELGTSGGKVSYDLSTEITPVIGLPLTIGFDYKHKGDMSLTGHAHFDNPPAALVPNALDQTVTHDLSYPNVFNVGVAYRVLPQLLLTGAFTLDRFIVYKRDLFSGGLGTTIIINRDYKNGHTFRLGGEFDLLPRLQLRAGILRDISPTRPETLNPSIPDSDVTAFSLGAAYEVIPNLQVAVAYFHAFFDGTTTTPGADVFPGAYDTRANIFTVGITWHLGEQPRGDSAALYQR